jgi:hypothetical protein
VGDPVDQRPETRVDITDTGCLRWTSDADTIVIAPPNDKDCDNDDASVDCDDLDPKVGPSKQERCDNQIDDDCDGIVDEVQDLDGDGFNNCDDCDDNNDTVYPGAPEICDGLDNDCNGVCDDGPLDADGDGYNICGSKIFDDGTCSDPHPDTVDCNDEDDQIYPGAEEICDGKDNDCDGTCDAEFDADGDDYTTCGSKVSSCNGETKADYVDCDDEDDRVHPHAEERCDGVDNNCDGIFYPETVACYVVNDADNTCVVGVRQCNDANGAGWAGECQASNDEAAPDNLCEAYDACDQAGAADPFECANMGATTSNIDCSLLVGPAGAVPEPGGGAAQHLERPVHLDHPGRRPAAALPGVAALAVDLDQHRPAAGRMPGRVCGAERDHHAADDRQRVSVADRRRQ